jgi:hypothetical protein
VVLLVSSVGLRDNLSSVLWDFAKEAAGYAKKITKGRKWAGGKSHCKRAVEDLGCVPGF